MKIKTEAGSLLQLGIAPGGPGIEPRPVPPHFHELPPHIRQHMVRMIKC